MATIAKAQPKVIGFVGYPNVTPELRYGQKASATAITVGSFVKYTSGLLVVCAADDNDIVGILTEAAVNGSTRVQLTPLVHGLLLEMNLCAAAGADYVSLVTDRGLQYGFAVASALFLLDTTETTAGLFQIVSIPGSDGGDPNLGIIGDTNIRVWVTPLIATTKF